MSLYFGVLFVIFVQSFILHEPWSRSTLNIEPYMMWPILIVSMSSILPSPTLFLSWSRLIFLEGDICIFSGFGHGTKEFWLYLVFKMCEGVFCLFCLLFLYF